MKLLMNLSCLRNRRWNLGGRRGFTLTEMAIVVGVIGSIAAGIFVAASVAEYRIEQNQASEEIATIVDNMRSLYAGQNAAAITAYVLPNVETPLLIQQGVFPQDMIKGGFAYHPWDQSVPGGSVQIELFSAQPAMMNQPVGFDLFFYNLPAEVCVDLAVHNTFPGPDVRLFAVKLADGLSTSNIFYASLNQLPISPLQASQYCTSNFNNIMWAYAL